MYHISIGYLNVKMLLKVLIRHTMNIIQRYN